MLADAGIAAAVARTELVSSARCAWPVDAIIAGSIATTRSEVS